MKIIVSQQNKKLLITFEPPQPLLTKEGKKGRLIVDNYSIAKADGFLLVIDKFIKRRKIGLATLKKANLRFDNVGLLTERTIRAIMLGLGFLYLKQN